MAPQLSPEPCQSVDGESPRAAVWRLHRYDLARLRQDVAVATEGWDWSRGRYGHSLPLTSRKLTEFGRTHENAVVTDEDGVSIEPEEKLDRCPYFREIFDSLPCAKSAFRILRRPPSSSYTLHADHDIGANTFRFQIPIASDPSARVVVTDTPALEDLAIARSSHVKVKDWGTLGRAAMQAYYRELVDGDAARLRAYQLEPGSLYWFDTRNHHNVFNFGGSDRLALVMDLVGNEWLFAQCSMQGCCVIAEDQLM